MKQRWQALVQRLDALSVRERLILFVTVLVGMAAALDTLWLAPAQQAYRQLDGRLVKQSAELSALRDALRADPGRDDVNRAVREQLTQTVSQMAQVNQQIQKLLPGTQGSTPLAQVLVHLLKRQPGLTLLRTEALPPELPGPGNDQGAGHLPPGLLRRGVALTVSGSYSDLTRYVATLESALPYVRWGVLSLKADSGPAELTLQLFLLDEVAQ